MLPPFTMRAHRQVLRVALPDEHHYSGPPGPRVPPRGLPQVNVLNVSLQLSKASVLVNHPNHSSIMQSPVLRTVNVLAAVHGT